MAAHGIWTPWSATHGDLFITQNKTNYFFDKVSYTFPQVETDGCNLPDNTLHMALNGDILYNSLADIAGFQFTVIGTDLIPNSASGGAAETAGFMLVSSEDTVLAFSLTGSTIPAGCGVLVETEFENGSPDGVADIVMSDSSGGLITPFSNLDMLISTEDWVGAFRAANTCSLVVYTDQATCEAATGIWYSQETLVGARQWNMHECGQHVCDLAVFGTDENVPESAAYMTSGHVPIFKIWNTEEALSYSAVPSRFDIPWDQGTNYMIDYLTSSSLESENYIDINYDLHWSANLVSFPLDLGVQNAPGDVLGNNVPLCMNYSTGVGVPEGSYTTASTCNAAGFIWEHQQELVAILGEGESSMLAGGGWIGSLTTILPTAGYWIIAPSPDPGGFPSGGPDLLVSGGFIENPTYDLHAGANLVSFPGSEESFVGNHFPHGIGEPWQNELLAMMTEASSLQLNTYCTINADVCTEIATDTILAQYTSSLACHTDDGTHCSDPQFTTPSTCFYGENNIPGSNVWTYVNIWGETLASCDLVSGTWYQGMTGSLMYLQPNKGYWIMLSGDINNFQFNLVKESYCTDAAYTDQATCEAAEANWRDRLVNA